MDDADGPAYWDLGAISPDELREGLKEAWGDGRPVHAFVEFQELGGRFPQVALHLWLDSPDGAGRRSFREGSCSLVDMWPEDGPRGGSWAVPPPAATTDPEAFAPGLSTEDAWNFHGGPGLAIGLVPMTFASPDEAASWLLAAASEFEDGADEALRAYL